MKQLLSFILCSVILSAAGVAVAADAPSFDKAAYTARFLELNKIDPMKNTKLTAASALLRNRVLDTNMHNLGRIEDITVSAQDGSLQDIITEITAGDFRETLPLNVSLYNINLGSGAFTTSVNIEQLQNNQAELMANLETAAGDEAPNPTLKNIMKADVKDSAGKRIGKVENVLINDRQKMVAALVIAMMGGGSSYVAVPYDAKNIKQNGGKTTIELTQDQAKIVADYAPSSN